MIKGIPIPPRVVFNFLEKCNMACPFCYCPFDGQHGNIDLWKRIIDRIVEWGTKSITFGGGDPFIYKEFPILLSYINRYRENVKFVQIDTNGLALSEDKYPQIKSMVNLIGFPLEGSTANKHKILRKHPSHFDKIIKLIVDMNKIGVPVKINTVVTRQNIDDLDNIRKLLDHYKVEIWSLYEFWALGPNALKNERYLKVDSNEYAQRVKQIREKCSFVSVDAGSVMKRKSAYFLVSQTGKVYTVSRSSSREYINLGNVFDDDILDKWNEQVVFSRVEARIKDRMSRIGNGSSLR